jgi:hypothetical protein
MSFVLTRIQLFKTCAALCGVAAVIAMGLGGLTASTSGVQAWVGGGGTQYMQQGGTTTMTNPGTIVPVSGTIVPVKAVPVVKAPPYGR